MTQEDNRTAESQRCFGAGVTDVGLQREHNEDSFAVAPEHQLFLVCDGMGGHSAGDVASATASQALVDFFERSTNVEHTWPVHFDTALGLEENRLIGGIRSANKMIREMSRRSRELSGMGTTVVAVHFDEAKSQMHVAHVGDSRVYLIRQGTIAQLTRDHSLLNEYMLRRPDLTEEQRMELPKNVITRALGIADNMEVDLQSIDVQSGDMFLLCSDGLSGMLRDEEILEEIPGVTKNTDLRILRESCERLVNRGNEHGGEDNITAVLVGVA